MADGDLPFEDEEEGERLKDEGMRRAANARPFCLRLARAAAHYAAMQRADFSASADDVYRICYLMYDLSDSWLGNAAGSVWRGGMWNRLAKFAHSNRKKRHRNVVWVWQLRPEYRLPMGMPSFEEVDLHMGHWAEFVDEKNQRRKKEGKTA